MENQYQHTVNGQSVLTADLNSAAEAAALADDRVLAELFRLTPFDGSTVSRGIVSHRHSTSGRTQLVAPNGASGSVLVNPFRAIIGSRTAVATDAKKNWRDIRSAIAVGTTTLTQVASFTANASGNPRWDLVYAAVAVDANAASVNRKVKNPTTKVIAGQSVVTTIATTVSILVLAGMAAASPVFPAVPADSGGTYYIPLAYVRIPNGFGASSTVPTTGIAQTAPALVLSGATGASGVRPATGQNTLTTAQQQSWGSSGTRPRTFIPSTAVGGGTLIFAIDTSVMTDGLVLDSGDWRGRMTKFTAMVGQGTDFAWNQAGNVSTEVPSAYVYPPGFTHARHVLTGFGQTFTFDPDAGAFERSFAALLFGDATEGVANLPAATSLGIYCETSTDGKLKLHIDGAVGSKNAIFWVEFSAPFI